MQGAAYQIIGKFPLRESLMEGPHWRIAWVMVGLGALSDPELHTAWTGPTVFALQECAQGSRHW